MFSECNPGEFGENVSWWLGSKKKAAARGFVEKIIKISQPQFGNVPILRKLEALRVTEPSSALFSELSSLDGLTWSHLRQCDLGTHGDRLAYLPLWWLLSHCMATCMR